MDSISTVFGRQLRRLRRARGLTQEQLGRAAKVDFKHLGGMERGIHAPSFAALERISKALNVEYHELFVPDGHIAGKVDQAASTLIGDVEKLDMNAVRVFFADLLIAIRKLEGGKRK